MSRLSVCSLLALLAGGCTGDAPALVVLCSVDQLPARVLDAALPHMGDGGFRRLIRQGVRFTDCAYTHACTSTGPGHATLSTGAPAAVHGIIGNRWQDPATGTRVYCAGQAGVEALLPGLGPGLGPDGLLAPTLGEGMAQQLGPDVKIVSVSWKDRSAILMGGPAADLAVWTHAGTGQMITNRRYADEVPGWLVAFNDKKLPDSWFGWRWERVGDEAAYAGLVDDRPFEARHAGGGRTLPQVIRGGLEEPGPRFYSQLGTSPLGNELVLEAALAALEGMDLGGDATPDLLCVGFSANDIVGHGFGPESVEVRDVLLRTDLQLQRLLQALDDRVGPGRYLFLLSSDHGVCTIPEALLERDADAGRGPISRQVRAAVEAALIGAYGPPAGGPYASSGEGQLYLNRRVLEAGGVDRREAAGIAAAAAAEVEGVARAVSTAELWSEPDPDDPLLRALLASVHPDRSGDVLIVRERNWLDGRTPASHGTPWDYDREVPFLAMGPGLPAGAVHAEPVTPGIGVVLAAHALGIPAPSGAVDEW